LLKLLGNSESISFLQHPVCCYSNSVDSELPTLKLGNFIFDIFRKYLNKCVFKNEKFRQG